MSVHVGKEATGKALSARRRPLNFVREKLWGGKECKGKGVKVNEEGVFTGGVFVGSCRERS
jgi:hypothetical protein